MNDRIDKFGIRYSEIGVQMLFNRKERKEDAMIARFYDEVSQPASAPPYPLKGKPPSVPNFLSSQAITT